MTEHDDRPDEADETPPLWVPPGHFYSPIPDPREVRRHAERLFDLHPRLLAAIEMNEAAQLELLEEFRRYGEEASFPTDRQPGRRYFASNTYFRYSDAFFLYSMIRHFQPEAIVEVGSGFSSALMLDVNEEHFENRIRTSFIEPYPERLRSLLSDDDQDRLEIIERPVQDVDIDVFRKLEANDILFVDSSHVSKTGSDVNHLLFEVLPALQPGVLVHFHDAFFPFEYPASWVYEGRAWNELYLLRAFLSYNRAFAVLLYPTFMAAQDMELAREWFPRCVDPVSSSLWLQRTAAD